MYDALNTVFAQNLEYSTHIRTSRFPVKGFAQFWSFLGVNSPCFWRDTGPRFVDVTTKANTAQFCRLLQHKSCFLLENNVDMFAC